MMIEWDIYYGKHIILFIFIEPLFLYYVMVIWWESKDYYSLNHWLVIIWWESKDIHGDSSWIFLGILTFAKTWLRFSILRNGHITIVQWLYKKWIIYRDSQSPMLHGAGIFSNMYPRNEPRNVAFLLEHGVYRISVADFLLPSDKLT